MRWIDCRGGYKAFISLGTTCQTAYQLKRLGLRRYAGPLDWFISSSALDVARLIRNRFSGYMEVNQLQPIGTTMDRYIVRDTTYNVDSYHDFPLSLTLERLWEAHPGFKEKIDRRVQRFLISTKRDSVCFIRTRTSKQEAQELRAALDSLTKVNSRLLIVNNHPDESQDVKYEDWGLNGISSVIVPKGKDWKGADDAWNTIMTGFKLI